MIDRVRELLSQTKLAGFFEEVQYPISKEELIEAADERQLPSEVTGILDRLPERVFDSAGDLFQHLAGTKEGE